MTQLLSLTIVSWERILKTIKQRNKNFIKNIIVFLLNNFIWTNKKQIKFCFYLPIGAKKNFNKKATIFLMRFLFHYFIVFKICYSCVGRGLWCAREVTHFIFFYGGGRWYKYWCTFHTMLNVNLNWFLETFVRVDGAELELVGQVGKVEQVG